MNCEESSAVRSQKAARAKSSKVPLFLPWLRGFYGEQSESVSELLKRKLHAPPTAPVLYRGRFHRGRVHHWCGTIANGPPTLPQMWHDSSWSVRFFHLGFTVEGFTIGAAGLPTVRPRCHKCAARFLMVSPFLSPPSGQYRAPRA